MSGPDDNPPSWPTPPDLGSAPGRGCLTALMFLVGVILLLPGLCALLFAFSAVSARSWPSDIGSLILVGLLVGGIGIALIWAAFRR